MARLIRTTIRPGEEILVGDAEYLYLLKQGLVYGQALPAPPDPDDVEVAGFLDNETSQTYARLLAQLAAAVDAGTGVLPDALRAAFGAPFMPETYGAVGDGATDDTASFTAMNTALADGAQVYLSKRYYLPDGFAFTKRVNVRGLGGGISKSSTASTGIVTDSLTADALVFAAHGSTIRDVAVLNTTGGTPTAGAGVRFTAGTFARVEDCSIVGFYDNLAFDDGYYYKVTNNDLLDPVRYGAYFRNTTVGGGDHGDQAVIGNVIGGYGKDRIPAAGVCWESGGGLRFIGNKINGSILPGGVHSSVDVGLLVKIADGLHTSVLTVTGNSIEGWNGGGVVVQQAGPSNTGTFGKIVITGNEIAGNNGTAVAVNPAVGPFRELVIDANSIGNCATSFLIGNVNTVSIGTNTHKAIVGTILTQLPGVTDLRYAPQVVSGDNVVLFEDTGADTNSVGPFAQAAHDLQREIGNVTSNSTYTDLWRISVPLFAAGAIDLTLTGNLNGIGAFLYRVDATFTRAEGGAVTVTLGTPVAVGGPIDVLLDTATTPGEVRVRVKRNGANGTAIKGLARCVVDGAISGIRKGA